MNIYYNNDYVASQHEFDTTRKSRFIVERLAIDPIPGVCVTDPMSDYWVDGVLWRSSFYEVAEEHIRRIHTHEYVEAVRTGKPGALARSQGFSWDPGVWTMAVAHTSGLVAAVSRALETDSWSGSLSSGLHHARPGTGCGYCTFNGLAAAVSFAVTGWDLGRILVLDLDAHGGGGTDEIIAAHFADRVVHADVTTSAFDNYRPRRGNFLTRSDSRGYLQDVGDMLDTAFSRGPYDLVVYNAGMDPINTGVPVGVVAERERMVVERIGSTPAVVALAGGYSWGNHSMDDVVDWHLLTLRAWAEHEDRHQ